MRPGMRGWLALSLIVTPLVLGCQADAGLGELARPAGGDAEEPIVEPVGEPIDSGSPDAPATFEAAPAVERLEGSPAPVNLASHPEAREFRTVLTRGAAEGPNFAGHYTVVTWGCGTMCQRFMIVDARDGEVYEGRTTAVGVEHRLDSRLLVVNPPGRVEPDACPPAACTPQYLLWDGERLTAAVDRTEAEAIRAATREYVRRETQVTEVDVEIEAVAEGWARVRVSPAGEVTDPATLYLRRSDDRWVGVGIGTAFAPEDLDALGIPASVRR